jgi:hypothetical protein
MEPKESLDQTIGLELENPPSLGQIQKEIFGYLVDVDLESTTLQDI